MIKRIAILLTACVICVSPALSQEIKGADIATTIGNKRVTLLTLGFKFPLYYSSSGNVSGDGTAVGLSKYFNPKETGRWWVASNSLCQKFPTWYKGKTFCFKLTSAGKNRLTWKREDGFSGKALIAG